MPPTPAAKISQQDVAEPELIQLHQHREILLGLNSKSGRYAGVTYLRFAARVPHSKPKVPYTITLLLHMSFCFLSFSEAMGEEGLRDGTSMAATLLQPGNEGCR